MTFLMVTGGILIALFILICYISLIVTINEEEQAKKEMENRKHERSNLQR